MAIIDEIIAFVFSRLKVHGLLIDMMKLEAKLASLSVVPFVVTILLLFVGIIAIWLTTSVFAGFLIYLASGSLILAIVCVFVFNLILCALLFQYLMVNIRRLTFAKTRHYLSNNRDSYEQTTNIGTASQRNRKKIAARTSASE